MKTETEILNHTTDGIPDEKIIKFKQDQVKRATKWRKENAKVFSIQCNVFYDDDVIKHLQAQPNKQRYIIELIRKDIDRQHTEAIQAKLRGFRT